MRGITMKDKPVKDMIDKEIESLTKKIEQDKIKRYEQEAKEILDTLGNWERIDDKEDERMEKWLAQKIEKIVDSECEQCEFRALSEKPPNN